MGQQQLLLLVLGVIIVGVAIVAGIGMFNASAEESVKDECVNQLMAISANAQQWYKKPIAMGGGGGAFDISLGAAIPFAIPERMGATQNCGIIDPLTGIATTFGYVITLPGAQALTIVATPNDPDYNWTATATVTPNNITTTVKKSKIQ